MLLKSRQCPFGRLSLTQRRPRTAAASAATAVTGLPAFFCALVLTCELMCVTLMAASAAPLDPAYARGRQLAAFWHARPFSDMEALRLAQSVGAEALEAAPHRQQEQQHQQQQQRQINKKSESPQWDDLGWAWGKRSAPPLDRPDAFEAISLAGLRAYGDAGVAVKKTPDWHDLGWAWGRRK